MYLAVRIHASLEQYQVLGVMVLASYSYIVANTGIGLPDKFVFALVIEEREKKCTITIVNTSISISTLDWGEPERAPHKR